MGSMSAVTGPMMMGARGALRVPVIDLDGSISTTGCTVPMPTRPAEEIVAMARLLAVPAPSLRKPPAMLLARMTAEPDSRLLPRGLMIAVPCSAIEPVLTKLPPDDAGQLKPDGALVSLTQDDRPPRS